MTSAFPTADAAFSAPEAAQNTMTVVLSISEVTEARAINAFSTPEATAAKFWQDWLNGKWVSR